MKLVFPILIEKGDKNHAWGAIVPDLAGCFSAADNEQDLLTNTREAILLHLDSIETVPAPSSLADVARAGFLTALVDVDFNEKVKRVNVTFSESMLRQIDRAANSRGKSRSEFLADAARQCF